MCWVVEVLLGKSSSQAFYLLQSPWERKKILRNSTHFLHDIFTENVIG